ncbi:putative bifunctional diguanylate cyclase/phosphodiesterase [Phormidium sp. CCY1219]|uniref:putative bifunctional diguanylate cyclase/phosphodiesterase n=1 Tax=Phormidium sp. CCY1219 TaxID=2886104 RepID=UPI002D1EAFE6|nr:EAL domain-containing protein [Phormidium sp. CCY1219]MEB3829129.1 EAL domain-containing protein [Phormidium sp. CCY1219]
MSLRLSVVLVEDNVDDAMLLLRELKRGGYELTCERVETASEMKAALDRQHWDLILADYALPQFSAPHALEIALERGLDCPFIIVSGQIGEDAAIAAMKAGAHDYIMKNQLARLVPAIERELREAAGRRSRSVAEVALRASERQLRALFESALDAMAIFNDDRQFVSVNPAACTLLGLSNQELIGRSIVEFIESPCDLEQALSNFYAQSRATGELKILRSDGTMRDVEYSATANFIPGLHLSVLHDITERKQAEEQLLYNAFYDPLTGLPNKAWFLNCLGRSLRHAKRRANYLFAVLFLDLDRFGIVKYSFGHLVADRLLSATARRLGTCLGPKDTLARVGTDEFAILIDNIHQIADATAVADKIHKELTLPFEINGHEMFSTASIGVAVGSSNASASPSPPDEHGDRLWDYSATNTLNQPEDYLRAADTAMYHAKAMGGGRTALFEPDMHAGALAMLQLETDLRRALKREELQLYYQPIVKLSTGQISGFEALIRWRHPTRGLVCPGEFIPIAEGTGLIVPMGAWVLEEAARQLRQWHAQLPSGAIANSPLPWEDAPLSSASTLLTMSVNLAGVQFAHPGLLEHIDGILQQSGIPGETLKLEITETAIMAAAESATALLLQLKEQQIQLCIDDFGTGYSSLSRLQRLPIDTLKIDKSFVSRMSMESESLEIVRTCVDLAHNLGMDVVAEGVETPEQLAGLRALKCEYGQGYFFSKPLDAKAATALLASNPQW